jgi:glycine dehydrogenase subunit 1
MTKTEPFIHPYIPNSLPDIQQAMLEEIGVGSIEDLYADIPDELRFRKALAIPEAILSESDLKQHVQKILEKNVACDEYL